MNMLPHPVILDRAGLEAVSCGCYAVVKQQSARLLTKT